MLLQKHKVEFFPYGLGQKSRQRDNKNHGSGIIKITSLIIEIYDYISI